VIKNDNDLFIKEDWPWKIYFTSESDFFVSEAEGALKFQRNSKRQTIGILDVSSGKIANKVN